MRVSRTFLVGQNRQLNDVDDFPEDKTYTRCSFNSFLNINYETRCDLVDDQKHFFQKKKLKFSQFFCDFPSRSRLAFYNFFFLNSSFAAGQCPASQFQLEKHSKIQNGKRMTVFSYFQFLYCFCIALQSVLGRLMAKSQISFRAFKTETCFPKI